MNAEVIFLFATFAVIGILIGFLTWIIHRLDLRNRWQAEMLQNYATYGMATKPTATVTDPGPIDDETKVIHEIHTRAVDRATEYLAEQAQVSPDRARAEAERLISTFETRGQPE